MSVNTSSATEVIKKPRKRSQWSEIKRFQSLADAEEFIRMAGDFSYRSSDKMEMNRFYRCKHAKRRGPQCAAKQRIFFPDNSLDVILYQNEENHTHAGMCQDKIGIRPEIKSEIVSLAEKGLQTFQIWRQVKGEISNRQQLYNFLAHNKKNKVKRCDTLGGLEKWCLDNSQPTSDENEPFVVNYQCGYPGEDNCEVAFFRAFISTPKLLLNATRSNHLAADATHKLVLEKFPALVLGTTDANRAFQLIGLAICPGETQQDFEFLFGSVANYMAACNTITNIR